MNMPQESRLLTIHCSGPEQIEPGLPTGGDAHNVTLWFSLLDALRAQIPEYENLLDPQEQQRAARFRFDVDRERFIIAHGLLRELLGQQLGERPELLRIARGPFGKPYIEGTDLRFNLSDTKDALLIAITQGHEIGADIETMTRTVDHMAVGEHYFTPEEVNVIATSTDPKRKFLEFWTRKESVLKASGVGIMEDLRVLRVDGAVNSMTIQHEAFMKHAAESYHLHTWHLGEDHIFSVAQEAPFNGVHLIRL
jgi:4'-phosphopantetheinyl transferase